MIVLGCYILATAIGGWQFQGFYGILGLIADLLIASELRSKITVDATDKYSSLPLLWRIEDTLNDIRKLLKKEKSK